MKNKLLLTVTSLLLASALVACGAKKGNDPTPTPTPGPVDPVDPPAPQVVDWPESFKPEVEALLTTMGVTDALPGVANGLDYIALASDLQIGVEFGSAEDVEAALTAYQANLLNGGFTEEGEDEYGDMVYASKNRQYTAAPWSGPKYDAGNYLVIDLATIVPDVIDIPALLEAGYETVNGFPTDTVEWVLEGGEIETFAGVNLAGTWYVDADLTSGFFGDYRYGDLWTAGLFGAELEANLLTAGFVYDAEYDCFFSPTQDVEADIHQGDDYTRLSVYGPYIVQTDWPTEDAAAIIEALVPGSTTVLPALEADEFDVYVGAEDVSYYGYGEIDAYGESTLLETYQEALTDANWTANDAGAYVSPAEDIKVELNYASSYGCLEIVIKACVVLWPTDEVAAAVAKIVPDCTDTVPAIEGAEKYKVYASDAWIEYYGSIEIDVSGPATLVDDYKDILADANWTNDATQFSSPNKQLMITLAYSTSYGLEITVAPYAEPEPVYPAETIAQFLKDHEITDTIPVFEDCNKATFSDSTPNGDFRISFEFDDKNAAAAGKTAYIEALTDAEYTFGYTDAYGDDHYISKNNQLDVCVWTSNSKVIADFSFVVTSFTIDKVVKDLEGSSFLSYYGMTFTKQEDNSYETAYGYFEITDLTEESLQGQAEMIAQYSITNYMEFVSGTFYTPTDEGYQDPFELGGNMYSLVYQTSDGAINVTFNIYAFEHAEYGNVYVIEVIAAENPVA